MRGVKILGLALCLTTLVGCVQGGGQARLDWCGYSSSYYAMTKDECDETRQRHFLTLERIMNVAEKKRMQTPPGIYAEYGFYLFQKGNAKGAIAYYEKERKAYPESGRFVDMLTRVAERQLDTAQDNPADTPDANAIEQETQPVGSGAVYEPETVEPAEAESHLFRPEVAEPVIDESEVAESEIAEPVTGESEVTEFEVAEPEIDELVTGESVSDESGVNTSGSENSEVAVPESAESEYDDSGSANSANSETDQPHVADSLSETGAES